jgi:hypothetical protein
VEETPYRVRSLSRTGSWQVAKVEKNLVALNRPVDRIDRESDGASGASIGLAAQPE